MPRFRRRLTLPRRLRAYLASRFVASPRNIKMKPRSKLKEEKEVSSIRYG